MASILARTYRHLNDVNAAIHYLLDIGEVPDDSPLEKRVQSALEDLYDAVHEIKDVGGPAVRESSPLVFPLKNRDMRFWKLSNGKRASSLFNSRMASRLASASLVLPSPGLTRYRAMTAKQYLRELEEAVITDQNLNTDAGYERVGVLV